MRALENPKPTPEQLRLVSTQPTGYEIIRGSAGSGKTTTALLRLNQLTAQYRRRRHLESNTPKINILVLTFNRTLCGYISHLAETQTTGSGGGEVSLRIDTFGRFAKHSVGDVQIIDNRERQTIVAGLAASYAYEVDFLSDEIDYVMGRFLPEERDQYLQVERTGRGRSPRMSQENRRRLINNIIPQYEHELQKRGKWDWFHLSHEVARRTPSSLYDVIVVDECQDFSATQLKAIVKHLGADATLTAVIDTNQRIYARGFTWREAGIAINSGSVHTLTKNYRNSYEIAALAWPLVRDLPKDRDSAVPDPSQCDRSGLKPVMLRGLFRQQLQYALRYISRHVNLENESVAFLHPKGGNWLDAMRETLRKNGLSFVEITRDREWPADDTNIALCTMHSAKGLEFDYVILIGLNAELMPHGNEEGDDRLEKLRRLLAMSITRAKKNVLMGYKPGEGTTLIDYLDKATLNEVHL